MKASVALYMEVSCTHVRWVTWLPHVLQAQSPKVIDDHQLVHQHLPLQSTPHTLSSCLHTYNLFMFTHLQTCLCLQTLCSYTYTMYTHLQTSWSYTYTNAFLIFQLLSCRKVLYKIFTHVLLAYTCSVDYATTDQLQCSWFIVPAFVS